MSICLVAAPLLLAFAKSGDAVPQYFGIYYHGHKIGYRMMESRRDQLDGLPAVRTENKAVTAVRMLGERRDMVVEKTTWATLDNRPLRELNVTRSNGQASTIEAVYGGNKVEIEINEIGKRTHKSMPLPSGPVCADVFKLVLDVAAAPGQALTSWRLEPGDSEFSKVELKLVGPETFKADGKEFSGIVTEMKNRGNSIRVFMSPEGRLLRQEWSIGVVETAESESMAMSMAGEKPPLIDLVLSSSLKPDRRIDNVLSLKEMKLRISGMDLSGAPSDEIQTVTKDGDAWLVDVHPTRIDETERDSIEASSSGQTVWTQPEDDLPSNDPKIIALAHEITKKSANVVDAGKAIMRYVHRTMVDDYGFGLTRSATEVLAGKRGSCVDYAVLTTTLMRAAGIPSRIASGLLVTPTYHLPNTIVYHAWSEFWDGHRWIGADATMYRPQLTAAHLKLCEGNADKGLALVPGDPSKVRIEVIDSEPK